MNRITRLTKRGKNRAKIAPSVAPKNDSDNQHSGASDCQQPRQKTNDGLSRAVSPEGHPAQPQTAQKQNNCCHNEKRKADDSGSIWTKGYTALTGIIVILMIAQTYISQQSVVGVQRAFVSLNKLALTRYRKFLTVTVNGKDNSIEWIIEPVWENTGSTPTKDLKIFNAAPIERAITPNTPIADIDIDFTVKDEGTRVPVFIAPRQQASTSVDFVSRDFLTSLKKGTAEYFLWGEATYEDVFWHFFISDAHISRYCYRLYGIDGDFEQPGSTPFLKYRTCHGNCTDSECYCKSEGTRVPDNITLTIAPQPIWPPSPPIK